MNFLTFDNSTFFKQKSNLNDSNSNNPAKAAVLGMSAYACCFKGDMIEIHEK